MTYDEYIIATRDTVRLMLWFVRHWLREHPEETFVYVLRQRADIFRKTDCCRGWPMTDADYEQVEWARVEAALLDLYRRTRDNASSATFEEEGLAVVLPRLEAKARLLEREGFNRLPKSTQCGSLRYDPPRPETPRRIFFHIGNAVCPKSIFDDPGYLPECLRCLMQKSAAEFGADNLETSTWLNSYPKWLPFFPAEWQEHLGPELRDVRIGMGYWGQFVNAAGGFNEKHARLFRETGRLPFAPRHSWCTFAALERHLRTKENR
jgi:hypothetical protein